MAIQPWLASPLFRKNASTDVDDGASDLYSALFDQADADTLPPLAAPAPAPYDTTAKTDPVTDGLAFASVPATDAAPPAAAVEAVKSPDYVDTTSGSSTDTGVDHGTDPGTGTDTGTVKDSTTLRVWTDPATSRLVVGYESQAGGVTTRAFSGDLANPEVGGGSTGSGTDSGTSTGSSIEDRRAADAFALAGKYAAGGGASDLFASATDLFGSASGLSGSSWLGSDSNIGESLFSTK